MRVRAALTALLAAASVLAVAAGDAPQPLTCPVDELPVLGLGGHDVTVPAPNAFLGSARETITYRVDLATPERPATDVTSASIEAHVDWTIAANDYDLVLGDTTTAGFQPIDAPHESAAIRVRHCDIVEIGVVDFLAPVPGEGDMTVVTTVNRAP